MEFQGKPGPIQEPSAGIQVLDRFQRFQTAAEYQEKFGTPPPPFEEAMEEKHWLDPEAMAATGSYKTYTVLEQDENGEYVFMPLRIPKAVAARVNLPGMDQQILNPFGLPQMPMPVRQLVPPEKLGKNPFGGGPIVVNEVLLEAERAKDPQQQILTLLTKLEALMASLLARLPAK